MNSDRAGMGDGFGVMKVRGAAARHASNLLKGLGMMKCLPSGTMNS